ncbi:MAG TPA: class I adenylate-forming enzyme family protein, partial [Acidimicrobiales bacterium]
MISLVRRAAARGAAHPAVVDDDRTTTYGDLLAQAEATAAYLHAHHIERFGILDYDAAHLIALLAGAALAGAEPCMFPPLETPAELDEQAARFDHTLVVTTHDLAAATTPIVDPSVLFSFDSGPVPSGPGAAQPLLVQTTGTTGLPKGVRHDWSRLLRRAEHTKPAPDQRWLLAYGPHQFGGIQVLVHAMAGGSTLIAPFPRVPRQSLRHMRTHHATHVSGTPTYWRFILAEMRADGGPVPALEQITLGGEAIPAGLIEELEAAFPGAHVSQVYAASEFGATGSVRDNRNGLPLSVLERGDNADVQMKIVDGEMWVRSKVGMLGYYGESSDDVDPDGWRPSGDLVEVVGDRILFMGRNSDIINVGGVKVHPLPVEERISAVPGVQLARVFGRPNRMTGAIVAVEVVPVDKDLDEDGEEALEDAIRQACEDLVAASRPRS